MKTLQVPSQREWRSWLEKNHDNEDGVWLGFHKKGSGERSITYQDVLDEALAHGWIDSIIRRIDEKRYVRKFTAIRRKPQEEISQLDFWRKDARDQSEEDIGSSHLGLQKCEIIAEVN